MRDGSKTDETLQIQVQDHKYRELRYNYNCI